MIQIQRPEQFTNAAARAAKERMSVRRYEPNVVEVTNTAKARSYLVRFTRRDGHLFAQCTCEAGTPTRDRVPVMCKHVFAAYIYLRGVIRMRRGH